MISSGITALATTSAAAITLLAAQASGRIFRTLTIINLGGIDALISFDGGTTYGFLPAGEGATRSASVLPINDLLSAGVLLKRPAGTDVTGLYAWAL